MGATGCFLVFLPLATGYVGGEAMWPAYGGVLLGCALMGMPER